MTTVTLMAEEEIETLDLSPNEVSAYVELIKEFGYIDDEGNEYKYSSGHVDSGNKFTLYIFGVE